MKAFFAVFCLFFNALSVAQDFPRGCETTGHRFEGERLVLAPAQEQSRQTLFLLRNHSKRDVNIENIKKPDAFMPPSYKTSIRAKRWAAFATDEGFLAFECKSMQGEALNCKDVIELCQFPRAKFALSNQGNYWVAENQSRYATIRAAVRKGIILRR